MKKVTLTNATVIPFFKSNANAQDEILRIIEPKAGSEFNSTIINFNVETKAMDTAESKAKIFEKCAIYAKGEDKIQIVKNMVKAGSILELSGYEKRNKSEKDGKYYNTIIVKEITPISSGVDLPEPEEISPVPINDDDFDDLPF